MSIALYQEIKALREQVEALSAVVSELQAQIVELLADSHSHTVELDTDTLQPKRGPGRPRKAAQ